MTYRKLRKINEYTFEVDGTAVPARIYTTEEMIPRDRSIEQLIDATTLPTLYKGVFVMPDIHEGYGVPIGCVLASRLKEGGIISPGAIGFDINCGVRVLKSDLQAKDVHVKKLIEQLYRSVPSGLGKGNKKSLSEEDLRNLAEEGPSFLVNNGIGKEEDVLLCESEGKIEGADIKNVSLRARSRGLDQVGTLGSGNHFLELQEVEEVFDREVSEIFGIREGQLLVMIHSGSRGFGHEIASDYMKKAGKGLSYFKLNSEDGQNYWSAMACAANFAWSNRHTIAHSVRKVVPQITPLYDVAHNIAKKETHEGEELLVQRKGATRSFWKKHKEIPEKYRTAGQPVLIPGSMGTSSYIMVGSSSSEKLSFGSTCHGAGREMSRSEAKRRFNVNKVREDLSSKGVSLYSSSNITEEAPGAYKDVDKVIEVVCSVGLSQKVARLRPLAVMKG